jgi:2-polyprenyl-6-hydroxyphenyl methylase/3-demethylubiquinone-9 3-methyltransferase
MRNDLTIYDQIADRWWSDDIRWVRTLKNLLPGRLKWFDRHIDCHGRQVLDLGCAGGFRAEALAARHHARSAGLRTGYDVGVGEALPYDGADFDAVVCVDVLEHVTDLHMALSEVARVLRSGGLFLSDTINCNPLARLATLTVAKDLLRLLPCGPHDPAMLIKPGALRHAMEGTGVGPGPVTGLTLRGMNRRLDLTFGSLPLTAILNRGIAHKTSFTTGDAAC